MNKMSLLISGDYEVANRIARVFLANFYPRKTTISASLKDFFFVYVWQLSQAKG